MWVVNFFLSKNSVEKNFPELFMVTSYTKIFEK